MYQGVYTKKNLQGGCQPAVGTTVLNPNRQLRLILWYVFEGKPRERLFEYIDCNRTTGAELCNSILKVFEKSPFNIKDCRSQTMNGNTANSKHVWKK